MTLDDIITPGTQPEVLGEGYGFTEGPAADRHGNVFFSDGQNNSIHRWEPGRPVTLFTDDSTDAIGMMFNAAGELYVCEGAAYRIVAFDVPGDCPNFRLSENGTVPLHAPANASCAPRSTASTSTSRTIWRSTSTAGSISPIPITSTAASRP